MQGVRTYPFYASEDLDRRYVVLGMVHFSTVCLFNVLAHSIQGLFELCAQVHVNLGLMTLKRLRKDVCACSVYLGTSANNPRHR